MLRFSANLSTLFQELPLLERLSAAARAGFRAVEVWFPYAVPAATFAAALRHNGLVCVGINSPPGNAAQGDWGLAADPSRRQDFIDSVEQAMAYARAIDCPNVHVMAGLVAPGTQHGDAWPTYVDNIDAACSIAERHGRVVLIEPLNRIDRPSYILSTQAQALAVIGKLQRSNLRIMLDLYHLQRGEGNLLERMRESLPHAGHVQFADNPGRHEPGTGEINFAAVFAALEASAYAGWVGCEYLPSAGTLESLAWLEHYLVPNSRGGGVNK